MTEHQTEADEAYLESLAEQDSAMWELAARPSTWRPVSGERIASVIRGESNRTEPTVFTRSDDVPLLYPARINMFLGEPEGCKTWGALVAIAQEIQAGNSAALIDMEDSVETAVERLGQLGLTETEITDGFVYCEPTEPFDEVAAAQLETTARVRERPLTLVVIDSMTEAMSMQSLDPDKGKDVTAFFHGLPRFITDNLRSAVVIIDHVAKSSESRGRWAIGSERKLSGLNGAAYTFTATQPFGRGTTGRVKIGVAKDRPGYVRQYMTDKTIALMVLASDPHTGVVTACIDPPAAKAVQQTPELVAAARVVEDMRNTLLAWVKHTPGMSREELLKAVGGSRNGASSALTELVTEGAVMSIRSGSRIEHFPAGQAALAPVE